MLQPTSCADNSGRYRTERLIYVYPYKHWIECQEEALRSQTYWAILVLLGEAISCRSGGIVPGKCLISIVNDVLFCTSIGLVICMHETTTWAKRARIIVADCGGTGQCCDRCWGKALCLLASVNENSSYEPRWFAVRIPAPNLRMFFNNRHLFHVILQQAGSIYSFDIALGTAKGHGTHQIADRRGKLVLQESRQSANIVGIVADLDGHQVVVLLAFHCNDDWWQTRFHQRNGPPAAVP